MSSVTTDDPNVAVTGEAEVEVAKEPVVWPMIKVWMWGFFPAVLNALRIVGLGWKPDGDAHADVRTSNMATYVYVAGWTTLLAALLIKFAPGASLWTLVILGFGQIILATALAYVVGRNRNETNDGDPG